MDQCEDAVLQLGAIVGLSVSWPTGGPPLQPTKTLDISSAQLFVENVGTVLQLPRPRPGATSPRQSKRRAASTRGEVGSDSAPDFVVY